jgi:hypothetical protein
VATPFDKRLSDLNSRLADDALAYGAPEKRARTTRKIARRKTLPPGVAAEAAGYGARSGRMDSGDLLTALMEGSIAGGLAGMDEDTLPAAARAVPKSKRKAWLKDRKANRKKLETEILAASESREEYIEAEETKAGGPKKDAFDTNVVEMLKEQAADIGVAY